jgi:hypothetical protein
VAETPTVRWKTWISACLVAVLAVGIAPAVQANVAEHLPGEVPSDYRIAGTSGGEIYNFGAADYAGSAAEDVADFDVVDMASTPTGEGYWLVASAGEVRAFGDAVSRGDASHLGLAAPIVSIAATNSGNGYWLASADGGIFTFGDAGYSGSVAHLSLAEPIVGMAPTADDDGYWMVAGDGGIFALGSAAFHGSAGAISLNQPIVDMVESPDGAGYWLIAQDGGVFSYGTVDFHGSLGDYDLNGELIVGAAISPDGNGYWMAGHLGSVFAFGSAEYHGGATAAPDEPIGAMAARPQGDGYWLASAPGQDWFGPPVPEHNGSGKRIVYSNSAQRLWLIEEDGTIFDSYLISGRRNEPRAGDYAVFSKSRYAFAGHDGITMDWMVRFAHGRRLAIGFHSIPKYGNGLPMQTEEQLGTYRSGGCVRQRVDKAEQLYHWAPIGTPVHVLP